MTLEQILERVEKAARCVNAAENTVRGDQAVDGDSWADLNHAATILEELERDLRSDVLTASKAAA